MSFQVPQLTAAFYHQAFPILFLCATGIISLLLAVTKSMQGPRVIRTLNLGALLICLVTTVCLFNGAGSASEVFLSGGYVSGRLTFFGQGMILGVATVISILMSASYLDQTFHRGETIALFHMVLAGMLTMVSTDDLVTLFVGLEMASIGVYALIGYVTRSKLAQEGAIKYFILGSVAAAVLLFGMGLVYATSGSLRISEIAATIQKLNGHTWLELGTIFIVAGIGFKMALVPFHMWTPDAYEGAPTGLTAFMATAMKVMVLIAAMRLFENGLDGVSGVWVPVFGFLTAASLLFGNIMALAQQSLKRILAYSSIAHSGYMALAFTAMNSGSSTFTMPSILFYLVSYVIVSLGAFAVIMWLENERCENIIVDDLMGLAKVHPKAAVALSVFMFSLGGMPPTVGFISKLYVFNAALSQHLTGLVVVAVIGSTISLYYYMRLIVRMFMMEKGPVLGTLIRPTPSKITVAVVGVCVILVIALGTILPEPVLRLTKQASQEIAGR